MAKTDVSEYATQGGGTATYRDGKYGWTEIPTEFPEFKIGDSIPEDWSTVPINETARVEMDELDDFHYSTDDPWWSGARSDW